MFKYLNNAIEDFPEIIRRRAATPAHDKLFEIRDDEEAKKRVGVSPHIGTIALHGNEG